MRNQVFEPLKALLLLGCVLVVSLPAIAISGTVVDVKGNPIKEARVCFNHAGAEQLCVETNATGTYHLMDSQLDTLRISKIGYHSETISARGQRTPLVLRRSPALWVRLVNKTDGEPISKGEVFVVYPSGDEKGPFPVNRAGVRVARVLEAGEIMLRAEAEGFQLPEPLPVTLVPGEETKLDLELFPKKD